MAVRLQLLLLAGTVVLSSEAACPCMPTPSNTSQQSAPGKPAYVGQAVAYGWGCAAHDAGNDTCGTANDTAAGQPNDWCLDQWCIVDPNNCTEKSRQVTYTAADDFFAYEACDANFSGNGWVGRCKNCQGFPTSHCTCGGLAGCPCLPGASKQQSATGKPAYVGLAEAYGSGCKAHDAGEDACGTANDTAAGQPNDWCLDQWCHVDKDNCDFKTLAVSYTLATDDYFSYETCDANFAGNGWVGRCKCADNNSTYCACPTSSTGSTGTSGSSSTGTNGSSTGTNGSSTGTNGSSTGASPSPSESSALPTIKLGALATSVGAAWVSIFG